MLSDIRLQKHQFDPGQELASNVAKLEQRLVLNSTWKFPHALLGTLPGQHGPTILTSRSYEQAQRMVDRAFNNFAGSLAKVQQKVIAGKMSLVQAEKVVGINGNGITPHSLLGRLESSLRSAEAKMPYGRGVSSSPISGPLGVGLSDYSATGNNPNSLSYYYGPGTGVPTYLRYELSSALSYGAQPGEIHSLISWTRNFSLRFHGTSGEPNWSWGGGGYVESQSFGTLPGYVANFGSSPILQGTGDFGTKNS